MLTDSYYNLYDTDAIIDFPRPSCLLAPLGSWRTLKYILSDPYTDGFLPAVAQKKAVLLPVQSLENNLHRSPLET